MMAYQNGFVVSILNNGHVVRETRGEDCKRSCAIPFDSEYKIRVKNPNSNHAKVRVFIDGTPVLAGERVFLMEPYSHIDLERFVDDLHQGKRFKFVPLSHADVQDPTSQENGLIRIEIQPTIKDYNEIMYRPVDRVFPIGELSSTRSATKCSGNPTKGVSDALGPVACCASAAPDTFGATVEGSLSKQSFTQSSDTFTDIGRPTVIEIQLRGIKAEAKNPVWRLIKTGVYYKGTHIAHIKNMAFDKQGDLILTVDKDFIE